MKKIYSELSRIQQDLKAPKTLYNKFGNYYYRNAEGILNAVKPLLNGLSLIINDEPIVLGDRFYIKATVTLTDGEESVSSVAYAREDEQKKGMDGCQITGACSSYARKYALNALLMIDDSKDSDDDSLSPKNPENSKEDKPADKAPEKPAAKAVEKPAEKPSPKAVVKPAPVVSIVDKVPPVPKETATKAEKTPVQDFLITAMKGLREARGITPSQNNKLFKEQMVILIKQGLVPDKDLAEYTMEEAEFLIDCMWKCFSPTGLDFKNGVIVK